MRANVNLDADAYTFASTYAGAKGIRLGAAMSELIRRAQEAPDRFTAKPTISRLGLLVRAGTDRVVTPEMVKELPEDDLDYALAVACYGLKGGRKAD